MTSPELRGQLRQWYPLGLVFLAIGLSSSLAYPFVTLFLTSAVHADPVRVTVYLVTFPVTGMVFTQVIGRMSDRRPMRRQLLIIASIAGMVAMALTAFLRNYWVLLAIVATLGAISGSMMSQGFAYARSVVAGSDRAAMITSSLRMLFSLAWVGGPPLAALLQNVGGFTALYATAAGMYAVAGIVTVTRLKEPTATDQAPGTNAGNPGEAVEQAPDGARASRPIRANASPRTIVCVVAAFIMLQGAGTVGVQMLPLFLKADLHSGVGQAGLILGLCAGLEIPLMLMFGALTARVPVRRLIMIGTLFSVAYVVLASAATHSWMLFVGQLLNATSIAAIQGLGVSHVQDLMPNDPGKASALYGNSFAAGTIMAGPLIAVAETLGYRSVYLIIAGICLLGLALIAVSGPLRRSGTVEGRPAAEPATAQV